MYLLDTNIIPNCAKPNPAGQKAACHNLTNADWPSAHTATYHYPQVLPPMQMQAGLCPAQTPSPPPLSLRKKRAGRRVTQNTDWF